MPSPIAAPHHPDPAQLAARRARMPAAEAQPFEGAREDDPIDSGTISFDELWQDKGRGLTFGDLIDIVNPLQHIPVVSTIYRAMTGDEMGLGARLAGGALYGGGVGLALGVMQAAVENATGRDIGDNILAFLKNPGGSDDATEAADKMAQAPTAAPAPSVAANGPETLNGVAPAAGAGAPKIFAAPPENRAAEPAPQAERTPPVPARPDQLAGRSFPARPDALHRARAIDPADSARIAATVENARRAQAATLLANAVPPAPGLATRDEAEAKPASKAETAPAAPAAASRRAAAVHSNAMPPGASPQWLTNAMERALSKYEDTLRLRKNAPDSVGG